MRVAHAEIVRWTGTPSRRLENARSTWSARTALLLRLRDSDGRLGQGEASPLPDYSPDHEADARAELEQLDFRAAPPLEDAAELCGWVDARVRAPSARFAAQTALLDLVGQRSGRPLSRVLGDRFGAAPAERLELAYLLDELDGEAALNQAAAAHAAGFRTFKLKVGRCDAFARELSLLRALRARYGSAIRLRLDANRAWSAPRAKERLAELGALEPEFVEEPVFAQRLPELRGSDVPLGLDESLQSVRQLDDLEPYLSGCRVTVLVLKPMVLGGYTRCAELAAQGRARGFAPIVSHLFDGPIAMAAARALALALAAGPPAMGLATHAALDAWRGAEALFEGPTFAGSEAPGLGLPPIAP